MNFYQDNDFEVFFKWAYLDHDKFSSLNTDWFFQEIGFHATGSIRLAHSKEHMNEFK